MKNHIRNSGISRTIRNRLARPGVEALEGRALLSVAGSPDFSYGSSTTNYSGYHIQGLAFVNFKSNFPAGSTQVFGEATQPDGKVVVVGSLTGLDLNQTIEVTRLNANGSTDFTFGTGGLVTLPAATGTDSGQAVQIQTDGKIVVAADVSPLASPSTREVAVYRLNADGSADTAFGTAGATDLTFTQGPTALLSSATTLAIGTDGKIVVGGYGYSSTAGFLPALARFDADGSVDMTFGTSGQTLPTFANGTPPNDIIATADQLGVAGLVIQADGTIDFDTSIVPTGGTGFQPASIAVGQLTVAGAFDPSFGTGGQVLLGTADVAGGLAAQTDGKLVVVGSYLAQVGTTDAETSHFDVYRLNADGSTDTTFGTMGEATPLSGSPVEVMASLVLIRTDGSILVGGQGLAIGSADGPTLVALNADGSTDVAFGSNGTEFLPTTYENIIIAGPKIIGLAVLPDGEIMAGTNLGVTRLLASGSSNDFDEDRKTDLSVLLTNFNAPIFAYRPSNGTAGSPDVLEAFGTAGAGLTIPAPGAYDGSGIDELAVYLPEIGDFAIRPSLTNPGGGDRLVPIGLKGIGNSIPAPADYTGSGMTEVAVYEPSIGAFVYSTQNYVDSLSQVTVPFGTPGAGNSIPAPADYDGVGHDEIAVYLPALAAFAYRPANGGADVIIPFGSAGIGNSIPVPGDYDGSGHTELAVYLPALGAFAYRPYNGGADVIVPFGSAGAGNSIPAPGDYDGSGHTELAVYLPNLSAFAYRPYNGGPDVIISFGEPGSGNTIPFTPTGAATLPGGGGGGGGGNGPTARPASYVDFVPELAGAAKKKDAGSLSTSQSLGSS